ncbi:MAG TPA: PQQ-binding-like beta-propeller repeat protein [Candidatus Paceibacterota bacterium]|nr:PQQ-binding-like beta-propeller repeat protein [Verrucomicrobiota bacterium]HRY47947.1 PQQ-binding-like beta-propeller repeat protein [Candidatus Paceibacterota bacterium]
MRIPRFIETALCLTAAFAGATASSAQTNSNQAWPQFRGPDGQATSQNQGLPVTWSAEENLVWKTPLPGPGGSSPIVWGDRIFVTGFTGYAVPGSSSGDLNALERHVICLDRKDGKILWRKNVPAIQPEQATVRDHGYASSTPLADADRLYVFFGKSGVLTFDHDGRQLWRANVGSKTHGWGSAASPLLYQDWIIVNAAVESDSLVALNKQTGAEVWRAVGLKESWNTPILAPVTGGATELVVAIAGQVLGFDPATGKRLWSCATGISWYMVPSLVRHQDIVFCIGGRTGGGLAVRAGGRGDVTESHRLWTLNKGSNVSSPLFHEGHLYWLHENLGTVYCAEAATGKMVFEERLTSAGQFYASPVCADGKLYCVNRRGSVFVIAAKPKFQLLA